MLARLRQFWTNYEPSISDNLSLKLLKLLSRVPRINFNFQFFRAGLTRLVTVTAWCTKSLPGNSFFIEWILKPVFLRGVFPDMELMEDNLITSSLNYTVVRPPQLLNGEIESNNYSHDFPSV